MNDCRIKEKLRFNLHGWLKVLPSKGHFDRRQGIMSIPVGKKLEHVPFTAAEARRVGSEQSHYYVLLVEAG